MGIKVANEDTGKNISMLRSLIAVLLLTGTGLALADACLIESDDDQLPIRMCQQNISIPQQLFRESFCQPQIADRHFNISFMDSCPEGAYGICAEARSEGVAYRQSIHYYSDADDEPVLQAYCEQFSDGKWQSAPLNTAEPETPHSR